MKTDQPTPARQSRTPATPDEATAVAALRGVRLPPYSWDKRFVRQLSSEGLTDRERPQVWRLFVRYRRQIQGQVICGRSLRGAVWLNLLDYAQKNAAPDFRKQQAALRDQARIDDLKKSFHRQTETFSAEAQSEGIPARADESLPRPAGVFRQ